MKSLLAVLFCGLVSVSCQDSPAANPIAPTPPVQTSSQPSLYPPGSWALTSSIISVTPHRCWRGDLAGLTRDYVLAVRRAEAMRLFVYWDPTDGIEYGGTLFERDFSLAGSFNRGEAFSLGCAGGGQAEVILSGRVVGRFSADGHSMSAEEVLSYLMVRTGEQVDVRLRWTATAPAG